MKFMVRSGSRNVTHRQQMGLVVAFGYFGTILVLILTLLCLNLILLLLKLLVVLSLLGLLLLFIVFLIPLRGLIFGRIRRLLRIIFLVLFCWWETLMLLLMLTNPVVGVGEIPILDSILQIGLLIWVCWISVLWVHPILGQGVVGLHMYFETT